MSTSFSLESTIASISSSKFWKRPAKYTAKRGILETSKSLDGAKSPNADAQFLFSFKSQLRVAKQGGWLHESRIEGLEPNQRGERTQVVWRLTWPDYQPEVRWNLPNQSFASEKFQTHSIIRLQFRPEWLCRTISDFKLTHQLFVWNNSNLSSRSSTTP